MMHKVVDRESAEKLRALVRMGKARVIREYVDGDPEIIVRGASGALIGIIGQKYKYMFEAALIEQGSGDGLLPGFDQTTLPVPVP